MTEQQSPTFEQHPVAHVVFWLLFLGGVALSILYLYFLVFMLGSLFSHFDFDETIIMAFSTMATSAQGYLLVTSAQIFLGKKGQFTEGQALAWSLLLLVGGSVINFMIYLFGCSAFLNFH